MAGDYGSALRIKGLAELSRAAKDSGVKVSADLKAANRGAAVEVKAEAERIAAGVDAHARTAAASIRISATAAWSKLTLSRTDAVPFALGSEWGAKHNIERTVGTKRLQVWGKVNPKTGRRRKRNVGIDHTAERQMIGWNQFRDWRGSAKVTASGEELLAAGASHIPGPDDLPPGYFMWPAFRTMIPALREQDELRIKSILDREFAKLAMH